MAVVSQDRFPCTGVTQMAVLLYKQKLVEAFSLTLGEGLSKPRHLRVDLEQHFLCTVYLHTEKRKQHFFNSYYTQDKWYNR